MKHYIKIRICLFPDKLNNEFAIRVTCSGNNKDGSHMKGNNNGTNSVTFHRNYTNMIELSQAISKGLSLQQRRMSQEEAAEAAEHLINFFGYNDRVIDNMLEPEDRDAFYTMEDIGVLQTEREETTLYDGREWRIHYWILNVHKIIELSQMKNVDTQVKDTDEFQIYEELSDESWKMN